MCHRLMNIFSVLVWLRVAAVIVWDLVFFVFRSQFLGLAVTSLCCNRYTDSGAFVQIEWMYGR